MLVVGAFGISGANGGLLSTPTHLCEAVAAWNRVERLRIHVIGIGEEAAALAKAISLAGDGRMVTR